MRFQLDWFEKSDAEFKIQIDTWFRRMAGAGYKKSTRVEHVQEAVNAVYSHAEFHDGSLAAHNAKWNALTGKHLEIFKEPHPKPSPTLKEKIAAREVLNAKENMLKEKLGCLEHWRDNIAREDAFLQGDEESVQATIHLLLDDAKVKLKEKKEQPWMETWYGADADKSVEWTKKRFHRAVTGEANFKVGAEVKGEVTLEFKGIKGKFKHETFVGIRGGVKGSASAAASLGEEDPFEVGLSAEAEASIEMGLKMSVEASVEVLEFLEVGGSAELFAGAMAKAGGKFYLSSSKGIGISASAEAFAGVKMSTEGHVALSWKGREIFKQKAEASLTAGVGAKAEFELLVPRVGATSITFGAGLTLGVGTEIGTSMEISFTNLRISGEQWIYEEVRQFLTPKGERYELMMGDRANQILNSQAIGEITAALAQLKGEKKQLEALIFR